MLRTKTVRIVNIGARLYSGNESSSATSPPPLQDLLGRRHNYLRISLTERCNLRCQYCMPAEGVQLSPSRALLTRAELARVVGAFRALGVDKVRLTGGEPTLRADLAQVVSDVRSAGVPRVAITTNGLVLTRRLPELQRAGLTALNVSLDSLRAERYERMTRRPGLRKVLAGVDLALQLGYRPVKLNVVLMRGFNDDEIADFVEYTREREVEVRFIEFMPFAGNRWGSGELMVPHKDVLAAARAACGGRLLPERASAGDTAEVWRVEGYLGRVGFISSMTRPFCATCNRMRITADGNLKVCLFGANEVSLRDAIRAGADDAQLQQLVRSALRAKKPQHAAGAGVGASVWPVAGASVGPGAGASVWPGAGLLQARALSSWAALTHLDAEGRARMVDVGRKPVTARAAEAQCALHVGARAMAALRAARLPKGDALTVAEVAGVLAAKRTADLLPLCHPLPLDAVRVRITLPSSGASGAVLVCCEARATARTGAEMEALTGAAVAALALYDMCKSADRDMRIGDLRVVRKSGGQSQQSPPSEAPRLRDYDKSPLKPAETFAPTDMM